MVICQKCGALGAIVTNAVIPDGEVEIYCNTCCKEFAIPVALLCKYNEKKEPTMQVSYNGFTGELFKLEKDFDDIVRNGVVYKLEIRDHEKKVTYSFDKVNLSDVKFLGGAVSFGE